MMNLIQDELGEFLTDVRSLFGEKLKSVIVYGSYARGDYNEHSDLDVMILVSLADGEIKKIENSVFDMAFELELKYGKVLSPIIKNQDFFDYWSDTLPFYRNIVKEGVKVA